MPTGLTYEGINLLAQAKQAPPAQAGGDDLGGAQPEIKGQDRREVLGKWLARDPRLLILDEPTIGVDIGAKSEIVATVRAMADLGMAVLVISSELEELMAISDRILVLHGGRITQDLNRRTVASEEELHHAIQGHGHRAVDAVPA
mgnify:CR=1 FL=1